MEVWGGNQPIENAVVLAGIDAWIYSQPFGDASAGGDVYYVSSCATGRITRLLVADVTGHGSAVQELALGLRTLMRKFVNYIDQTRFVQAMNGQFAAQSKNGNFATAVVTTFFSPTRRLSICNAGHPPPLIYRAAEGRWRFLEERGSGTSQPANLPLGILDLGDYEQFDVELAVGDLVLCYTDSLPESHDGDGQMLCQEGLLRVVNEIPLGEPAAFVPCLLDTIAARHEGNLRKDDVTAMLLRPNGSAPTKPLKERLLAPFRILRAALQSIGHKEAPAPWPEFSVANIAGSVITPLSGHASEESKHSAH
jgi:serine phosphatase RsbU (regulator of sigma subunit)